MTKSGPLGWITDEHGYRYQPDHPLTGLPWPPIPAMLTALWAELCDPRTAPDCCLVYVYDAAARMGLHRDADEADFRFPVLSVSLGDTATGWGASKDRIRPARSAWPQATPARSAAKPGAPITASTVSCRAPRASFPAVGGST